MPPLLKEAHKVMISGHIGQLSHHSHHRIQCQIILSSLQGIQRHLERRNTNWIFEVKVNRGANNVGLSDLAQCNFYHFSFNNLLLNSHQILYIMLLL